MKTRLLVTAISVIAAASAYGQSLFHPVGNDSRIGYDSFGCICYAVPLSKASIGSLQFPIFATFSSSPDAKKGVLPRGWTLPIIESRAYLQSESTFQVVLPNGEILLLDRPGQSEWTYSSNGWGARQTDTKIKIRKGLEEFTFDKGYLTHWTGGDGNTLLWKYGKEKGDVQIVDARGNLIAAFEERTEGFDHKLEISTGKQAGNAAIRYVEPPTLLSDPISKKEYGVEEIVPAGREAISLETDKNGDNRFMRLRQVKSGKLIESYSWDAKTGRLVELSGVKIAVRNRREGSLIPEIATILEGGVGKVLQMECSERDGVRTYFRPDGSVLQEFRMVASDGHEMLRKVSIKSKPDDDHEQVVYRARLAPDGSILRDERGEFSRVYQNGLYRVYHNGKLVREY